MGRSAAYTIAVSIDKQPEVIYNSVDELSKELNIKKQNLYLFLNEKEGQTLSTKCMDGSRILLKLRKVGVVNKINGLPEHVYYANARHVLKNIMKLSDEQIEAMLTDIDDEAGQAEPEHFEENE